MTLECEKREGEWSNTAVLQSVMAAAKLIANSSRTVGGLVINGDLTAFGHAKELDRFKQLWIDNKSLRSLLTVYPGLGNHDYQNNIDDCTANLCADRMLSWLKGYVDGMNGGRLTFDHRQESKYFVITKHFGSLAYSWSQQLEAVDDSIVFFQLHNFPTYNVSLKSKFGVTEWHVANSLTWLTAELSKLPVGQKVVLNLHDFDSGFSFWDQQRFKEVLTQFPLTYVAIFFAHFHSATGLNYYWCLNGRPVPLLHTGSVPAGNYAIVQLTSSRQSPLKNFYKCHVSNLHTTTVSHQELNFISC